MPTTITKILTDMKRFETSKGAKRNPKDYGDATVKFLIANVFLRNKQILFRTQVDSITDPGGKGYDVNVMFSNIKISETKEKGMMPVQDWKTEKQYYMTPVNFASSVQVKCTCSDFRHTWEWSVRKNNGLIGFPRKYTRKTTYWPERNPKKVMGVCKHLYSILRELGTIRVLRP